MDFLSANFFSLTDRSGSTILVGSPQALPLIILVPLTFFLSADDSHGDVMEVVIAVYGANWNYWALLKHDLVRRIL